MNVEWDRKEMFGRIRFIPEEAMGAAVNASEEAFGFRCVRGFSRFSVTGAYTAQILLTVFKALVPDWHMIIGDVCEMDAMNEIESLVAMESTPEQDLSQNARDRHSRRLIMKERNRVTYIRKKGDL
jgi:hypothetical protein